ncbi:MAG: NYN domain-containing protein [Candidatus Diapherotrites archaeon]|jgi:uncharacterized LabA/DUF88 family protein|nr:NYN domain-containing protein [Candidatus Diapherotrites archaeon]
METIIFVDGSNLYHSIQETGFKPNYINYHKLFEKISNETNPTVRFYITALTKSFSEKERASQQSFFSILKKNPNLSIHFGKLQKTRISNHQKKQVINSLGFCKKCIYKAKTLLDSFSTANFKEKGVDVRIAVDLVTLKNFERAILISGDTDLVPAVEIASKNKRIINAYFDLTSGKQLRDVCTGTFRITGDLLKNCLNYRTHR